MLYNEKWLILITSIFFSIIIGLGFLFFSPLPFFASVISIVFLIIIFFNPKLGLFGLLIIRSTLDILRDIPIYTVGSININAAALISVGIFVVGLIILIEDLIKEKRQQKNQHQRKSSVLSFINVLFSIWLLSNLLSCFQSKDLTGSLLEWLRIGNFFIIFLIAQRFIKTQNDFRQLIKAIFLSSIIPIITAYYQIITHQGVTDTPGVSLRIQSTFAHSNLFAFYLVFLITFLFITFINTNHKINKALLGMYMVVALIPLIFTFTRSAWIGLTLILLILVFFRFQKYLVFLPFIFIPILLFFPEINNRIYDLTHWQEDYSILWRFKLWDYMFPLFLKNPFLGYGLGRFSNIAYTIIGFQMEAHNDYIKMLIEGGLIGFIPYITLLLIILFQISKFSRNTKDTYLKNISLSITAIIIIYLFISSGDNLLDATALQWIFWSILGSIMGLIKKENNQPNQNSSSPANLAKPLLKHQNFHI